MPPYRLLALDLDGSMLTPDNRIAPATGEAILAAAAQGIRITIATGRMFSSAAVFASRLGLDIPLITYNGALVRTSGSGETLHHTPMPTGPAREVLHYFRERRWPIYSFIDDRLYVEEITDEVRTYGSIAFTEPIAIGGALYHPERAPTKLLAPAESVPGGMNHLSGSVKARFDGRLMVAVSTPRYLDICHPQVNKGRALQFVAHRYGIPPREIAAIGDSENDIAMFRKAGLRIAMGNAREQVKDAADHVTSSNRDDGMAHAIRSYILP